MNLYKRRKKEQTKRRSKRVFFEMVYWVLYIFTIPRIIYYIIGGDEEGLYLQICSISMMTTWDVENNYR